MASKGRELTLRRHAKVCGRKKRFESEQTALGSLRAAMADGGGGLNVYRCLSCKGWHIGHTPARGADRR